MPRTNPELSDDQKDALKRALEGDDAIRDDPYYEDYEPRDEDQTPSDVEEEDLDVAGNFVQVIEELPEINNNQRRIAYYLAKGFSSPAIAAKCGTSASYVRALKMDPRIKRTIEIFRGGEIYDIAERISAQEVLDSAAVRAAELLAEKMNAALDENAQIRAALAILDRTGHEAGGESSQVHVHIDRSTIEVFKEARQEAGIEEAEYELLEEG